MLYSMVNTRHLNNIHYKNEHRYIEYIRVKVGTIDFPRARESSINDIKLTKSNSSLPVPKIVISGAKRS